MRQVTLATAGFERYAKTTRRATFLAEMDSVVPWRKLFQLIEPVYPKAGNGRPPVGLERMLRIHFLQHWFNLSDPAVEDALYDSLSMRRFVGIDLGHEAAPDETTMCRFRHLLERHGLAQQIFDAVKVHLEAAGVLLRHGTIVDATIIAAPSSTKNEKGKRDPEMHQTKKGNQWYFGIKAHIGVDAESGLVHTVIGTPANVADITKADELLHGDETIAFGDAGYIGVDKRPGREHSAEWHVAMKAGQRRALDDSALGRVLESLERLEAQVRARVEHPFRVVKRQFGYMKVRYRGLAKNTAQLHTLFALSNLWMARRRLLATG